MPGRRARERSARCVLTAIVIGPAIRVPAVSRRVTPASNAAWINGNRGGLVAVCARVESRMQPRASGRWSVTAPSSPLSDRWATSSDTSLMALPRLEVRRLEPKLQERGHSIGDPTAPRTQGPRSTEPRGSGMVRACAPARAVEDTCAATRAAAAQASSTPASTSIGSVLLGEQRRDRHDGGAEHRDHTDRPVHTPAGQRRHERVRDMEQRKAVVHRDGADTGSGAPGLQIPRR